MYFLKRNNNFNSICSFIRLYSKNRKSHYEVLNLKKNCTDKEIKDAFIQMSKEYHPDKNKDAKAQGKFVQIVEAYNILSKPSSRANYDHVMDVGAQSASYVYKTHTPHNFRKNPFHDPPKQSKNTNTDYYGVKGVKKLPNVAIILICFSFALIGTLLQVFIIRQSYVVHRRRTQEKSMMLAEELDKVRANAEGKTNDMQTRALLEKIVNAANPTVATASLGQALANEKK
ncbi:dnaJ-like protein 60 [Zerene cesonia]|uniref:dnaJ-like protein 60 n=1 Tax=Zerene cesonia TaxID=33412 RepID=UPI0018E4F8AE|nr:dnaJ-like protein 60 [Zerene cesonia]